MGREHLLKVLECSGSLSLLQGQRAWKRAGGEEGEHPTQLALPSQSPLPPEKIYILPRWGPTECLAIWLHVPGSRSVPRSGLHRPMRKLGLMEESQSGLALHAALNPCPKQHPSACFPCLFLLGQMTPDLAVSRGLCLLGV